MTNVITKTRIDTIKDEFCPHCEAPVENITLDDGETITLDPRPANVDASLLWGCCEICLNVLYMMDLAMIPEQGLNFFNDYSWAAEGPSLYSLNVPGYNETMYLAEYRNVHDVMLIGKEEDEIYKVPVSWLNLYRSPLWAADDLEAALNRAAMMAETILSSPTQR